MAVSTLSSRLVANNIVKARQPGTNFAYVEYTTTASLTVGDVIQMVPVPHGARVLDVWAKVPGIGTAGEFNVGHTADPDRFLKSDTMVAARPVVRATLGLPLDISISDDIDGPLRYDTIDIQFAGQSTNQAGIVFGLGVWYDIDNTD